MTVTHETIERASARESLKKAQKRFDIPSVEDHPSVQAARQSLAKISARRVELEAEMASLPPINVQRIERARAIAEGKVPPIYADRSELASAVSIQQHAESTAAARFHDALAVASREMARSGAVKKHRDKILANITGALKQLKDALSDQLSFEVSASHSGLDPAMVDLPKIIFGAPADIKGRIEMIDLYISENGGAK